jgi:uncharacterized protein
VQVSTDALVQWVQEEKLPPYLDFTDDNQGVIFNSGIKINVRPPQLCDACRARRISASLSPL